jgi:predicted PolB exonuclease-like 3'-5' exonuclease
MITRYDIESGIIIDIETVPEFSSFEECKEKKPALAESFKKRAKWYADNEYRSDLTDELLSKIYFEKSPLYSEYGKIVVISCGGFKDDEIATISFSSEDNEEEIINNFFTFIYKKNLKTPTSCIIGYNINTFDVPFILKRAFVNNIKQIPPIFRIFDKKPWELSAKFKDIFLLWQLNTRNFVSLDAVASCLGIETHKDMMNGSMVGSTYYIEKDLNKIVQYCEMDVVLTGKVMKRLCLDA